MGPLSQTAKKKKIAPSAPHLRRSTDAQTSPEEAPARRTSSIFLQTLMCQREGLPKPPVSFTSLIRRRRLLSIFHSTPFMLGKPQKELCPAQAKTGGLFFFPSWGSSKSCARGSQGVWLRRRMGARLEEPTASLHRQPPQMIPPLPLLPTHLPPTPTSTVSTSHPLLFPSLTLQL